MEEYVHDFIVPFVCALCCNWFRSVRWMISLLAMWSLVLLCAAPLFGSHLPRFFVPIFSFSSKRFKHKSTNRDGLEFKHKQNTTRYYFDIFVIFSALFMRSNEKINLELFTRYNRHAVNWNETDNKIGPKSFHSILLLWIYSLIEVRNAPIIWRKTTKRE